MQTIFKLNRISRDGNKMDLRIFCLLLLLVRIVFLCLSTSLPPAQWYRWTPVANSKLPTLDLPSSPTLGVFESFVPNIVSPCYSWLAETSTVTLALALLVSFFVLYVIWRFSTTSMVYFVKCAVIGTTGPVFACARLTTFTRP